MSGSPTAPAIALVIAGGQGTRLAATHGALPKPLVAIHGMPLLAHVFHQLRRHGVQQVYVALRHRAAEIEAFVRRHLLGGFRAVHCLHETQPLGTAGALGLLPRSAHEVLVLNGDLLSGIDLTVLAGVHQRRHSDLSIATHWESRRLELGEVVVDGDECVTDYLEKPLKRYRISSGTYVVGPAVRALVDGSKWLPFPDLVQQALGLGLRVHAHDHGAAWIDVNTAEQAAAAERLLREDPLAFGLHPSELHEAALQFGIQP